LYFDVIKFDCVSSIIITFFSATASCTTSIAFKKN
jgi:hypothetical protein